MQTKLAQLILCLASVLTALARANVVMRLDPASVVKNMVWHPRV